MIKIIFCNKCHKRIQLPDFLLKANINGNIRLKCGNCKNGYGEIKKENK